MCLTSASLLLLAPTASADRGSGSGHGSGSSNSTAQQPRRDDDGNGHGPVIATPAVSSSAAVAPVVVRLQEHLEERDNDRAGDERERGRRDGEHAPTLVFPANPRVD